MGVGSTPLQVATRNRRQEVVQLLKRRSAATALTKKWTVRRVDGADTEDAELEQIKEQLEAEGRQLHKQMEIMVMRDENRKLREQLSRMERALLEIGGNGTLLEGIPVSEALVKGPPAVPAPAV